MAVQKIRYGNAPDVRGFIKLNGVPLAGLTVYRELYYEGYRKGKTLTDEVQTNELGESSFERLIVRASAPSDLFNLEVPGNIYTHIIIDSGKFPWAQHKDRFSVFNQPEPSYNGVVYTDVFGEAAFIGRARTVSLRNTGSALSSMNAFLLMQGLETLSLCMERHTENALKVVEYLSQHEKVSWVSYAGLPTSEFYPLAEKYMQGKPSAILSFGLKDGYEAGVRFYGALKIFKRLVSIGDAKSLAWHPASTTHRQLSEAEQKEAGVFPEMIRLSVGIEHIDDILADLEQALNA